MTTRGSLLSARRLTRVVAPLLLATLALGACSDDEPTAAPSPSTSESPSESPTPTPSESESPSDSPSPTPTVTATPSATPSVASPRPRPSATATPSTAPTAAPTTAACAASRSGAPNTTGMSAAAAATARKLHAAAKSCDAATLVAAARADSTGLAGEQPPSAIFTPRAPQNFVALATLLTMPPTETFDGTIQPRVFSEKYSETDAEWDAVIRAGLVTRAAATKMRQEDGGYTGYRVGIAGDGTWTFFTTGR